MSLGKQRTASTERKSNHITDKQNTESNNNNKKSCKRQMPILNTEKKLKIEVAQCIESGITQ